MEKITTETKRNIKKMLDPLKTNIVRKMIISINFEFNYMPNEISQEKRLKNRIKRKRKRKNK